MLFNTLQYGVFLVVVFVLFWALARYNLLRTVLLLAASYFFYACWNWKYLFLIWGSCTVDYVLARLMSEQERPGVRKALVAASVCMNLAVLCTFKYFNFFADSVSVALNAVGIPAGRVELDLILPMGISFHTFITMSYVIDIYRRELPVTKSYIEYLLFVSFFPQLVAGPITRASVLVPQFTRTPRLLTGEGAQGLFRIMVGLFKKVVIADFLATNLVDRVFDIPSHFSSLETLVAVYAYAIQIYCDFSGYSDIAIGSAKLLGFDLMKNFDAPYRASNLQDFWRRWHISLSTWLRDYLYIPLGGSRGAHWQTYLNLAITMLLGGLWHGASWNFVTWGAMHGIGLGATRAWQRFAGPRQAGPKTTLAIRIATGFVTFHFVCLAWVFFRADDFKSAIDVIKQIGELTFHATNLPGSVLLAMAAGFIGHYLPDDVEALALRAYQWMPAPAQGVILAVVLMIVHRVGSGTAVPFIYFQF
jgi:D-alanyl-lipoteichoic acid acyltransferase DltB (MBOAT superfamily)